MVKIKRRQFLQFAGSTLATLGLSQWDVVGQSLRYAQVLAQSTPRKLALLVGINAYGPEAGWSPLNGCTTDVQLQRELLVHRFGFDPADVLVLTDQAATRDGILTAFEEHLINQAKAGDVVVFHYSGHGSRVVDPDRDFPDGLNSTLVPIDSPVPAGYPNASGTVRDIMGHTLFLLMSALPTDQVTMVLDSCHSGGGKRGNLLIRARDGGNQLTASPEELAYQQQWLTRLNLSPEEFMRRRRETVAKGVVITSARRNQYAADIPISDFHAGAFTYLMTRYLWQQTQSDPIESVVANLSRSTQALARQESNTIQEPEFEANLTTRSTPPVYFVAQTAQPAAEAVITQVNGDRAQFWLGGVGSPAIAAFNRGAVLTVVDEQGQPQGQVQLTQRQGLVGEGQLMPGASPSVLKQGKVLQERARVIPSDLALRIGLDASLGDDLASAQQALQQLSRIEPQPLNQQQEVQYILGRVDESLQQRLETDQQQGALTAPLSPLPAVGQIGLFSPGLDPLPGSFGLVGETGAQAVTRLQAKLRSLLAARLVKLLLNLDASRLNVTASLQKVGEATGDIVGQAFTVRGGTRSPVPTSASEPGLPRLTVGTQVQFQITNREAQNLYVAILVIDPEGEMVIVFPNNWSAPEDAALVPAGQTIQIPAVGLDRFRLTISPPMGVAEALVIASSAPLNTALAALQTVARQRGQQQGPTDLGADPAAIASSLLNDLNAGATRGVRSILATPEAGGRAIDSHQLAALSIPFEVV